MFFSPICNCICCCIVIVLQNKIACHLIACVGFYCLWYSSSRIQPLCTSVLHGKKASCTLLILHSQFCQEMSEWVKSCFSANPCYFLLKESVFTASVLFCRVIFPCFAWIRYSVLHAGVPAWRWGLVSLHMEQLSPPGRGGPGRRQRPLHCHSVSFGCLQHRGVRMQRSQTLQLNS